MARIPPGPRPQLPIYIRQLAVDLRLQNSKLKRLRTDDRLWEHKEKAVALLREHLLEGIEERQLLLDRLDKLNKPPRGSSNDGSISNES